jgi:hypothetical protein
MEGNNRADFFTLLLQDKMRVSALNALRYCVRTFVNRYDSLVTIRYYEDEVVAAVDILIQAFFNSRYDAFFSEHFYKL